MSVKVRAVIIAGATVTILSVVALVVIGLGVGEMADLYDRIDGE